jgi:hypothetical protein
VKQYVKLLKGKRLKSVVPAGTQPCFCLVHFPAGRASIVFRAGQTREECGSSGCVIASRGTTAQGNEESGRKPWDAGVMALSDPS